MNTEKRLSTEERDKQIAELRDFMKGAIMSNFNDCYQCGGWMTADDIQQRDFHGLCNRCLLKASQEIDAAYARHPEGDTMRVPNRDYPSENDEVEDPIWVNRDGEWVQVMTDPIAFTNALSSGDPPMWQDLDGEWFPINDTSPEWVRAAHDRLEETR